MCSGELSDANLEILNLESFDIESYLRNSIPFVRDILLLNNKCWAGESCDALAARRFIALLGHSFIVLVVLCYC